MNAKRSLVVPSCFTAMFVAALSVAGCQDDPAPTPAPEASATAAAKVDADKKPKATSKLDPLAVKTYRAESCYFGTMSLRQARAAYTESLGGAEPAAGKIPNFGAATADRAAAKVAPAAAGSASAAPGANAKAPAASGSAKVSTKAVTGRPRPVPYERHARSCTVAAGIKAPAAPGLDEVLAEYAPFAVQLSKDIAAANSYYAKEEFKNDEFAKGKELHKKLTDGFAKLDDMHKKLGEALNKFRDTNKPDTSKDGEGQKLAAAAVTDARDAMVLLTGDAVDAAKVKEELDSLEKNVAALKKYGDEHKDDAWARITTPSLETFHKQAKEVADKPDLKTTPPDDLLQLVTYFTRVLESQNRGLTRQVSGSGADFMRKRPSLRAPGGAAAPAMKGDPHGDKP